MKAEEYHLLDFEVFRDLDILKTKTLILWGAEESGRQLKRTLKRIDVEIDKFCDFSINKWGTYYDNAPVISPYKLKKMCQSNSSVCIISCILMENDMLRYLQELKLNQVSFLSYWGIKTACAIHGIVLESEGSLPVYDDVWKYQQKYFFKNTTPLMHFLKEIRTYKPEQVWNLSPGKVASKTIGNRLKHAGVTSLHLHEVTYPSHLWKGELKTIFDRRLKENLSCGVKIVTGVREPLSRDYSAFWQPFSGERPYLMPILNKDFQKMYEQYLGLLFKNNAYKKMYLKESYSDIWRDEFEWFNEELKENIGIDIYQYPFDCEKGYQIICEGNIQIFIYQSEKLDTLMEALGDFLGKNISSLENTNESVNKAYHLAYKEFRKMVKLPRSYVDHYYKNNIYMNHFYSKDEQQYYLSKWEDNIR